MSRFAEAKVGVDGDKVVLTISGRSAVMYPEVARLIGSALVKKAGEAELARPEVVRGLIRDQGLLMRLGIGLGLVKDPKIRHEARKFAEEDRDLRRFIPGGVPSGEKFGTPSVEVGAPKHA